MTLDSILQEELRTAMNFYTDNANASSAQRKKLEDANIKYIVDDNFGGYAQFEFSSDGHYVFRFKKEAVFDIAAIGEEAGHAYRLILNDKSRSRLLQTSKDSPEHQILVAIEEYAGRYAALAYLNHHGIKEYNKLLSQITNERITLYTNTTKPSDAISHFYGYSQAEIDFRKHGVKGLRNTVFNNDFARFERLYRKANPIITSRKQFYEIQINA